MPVTITSHHRRSRVFVPRRVGDEAGDDYIVRRRAEKALGALGEHAAPHAPAIVERLQHAKAKVRSAAVKALGAPCSGQARGAAREGYCRTTPSRE